MIVQEVQRGSAADRARIEVGDVIVSVAGYQVGLVEDRLYQLSEEINRRASETGAVTLLIQDHRSYGLASVRIQLDQGQQSLSGELTFDRRIRLPSDATVTVSIENVSRPFYQVHHGTISFRPTTTSNSIPFEISYDPAYVDSQDVYQVRATVTSGGRTIMHTTVPQRVLTRGNPSQVRLTLQSIEQLASSGGGGVVTAGYPNYNQIDDQLVAMYRRYLKRDPGILELAALRNFPNIENRLDSIPIELMAAQEYFDAAGNNNRVWLAKVFQEIVGRPADLSEQEQWMQRYAELRFSRTELLRQLYSQVGK